MEPITLGVLAGDDVFKHDHIRKQLEEGYRVTYWPDAAHLPPAEVVARCRTVEVVIGSRQTPRLPDELAGNFGRLRYFCYFHGTIRHMAAKSLLEAGLIVTNWGDQVAGVAEAAMALLLCQLKQLPLLHRKVIGGEDQRICQEFPCTLAGRDVGLYGFGPIGRHMYRMLQPFDARIAIYDPYARDIPADVRVCSTLRELFSTCQIISVHCGLNDVTRNSVTAELLALLPQGAVFVNTARGYIVDEQALAHAVAAGRISAGIDVIHNERDWPASPLAPHPQVVLTGHRAGGGKGYPPGHEPPPKLPGFVLENLRAYREGKPLKYVVTAQEYDLKT